MRRQTHWQHRLILFKKKKIKSPQYMCMYG
uniref:Uncharacterized protein n=1 Tax=Arundo donax TaxID=35708 RepID=A0A0A9AY54_ARUDO